MVKTPNSTGVIVTTRYRPPYQTPNMNTGRSSTRQRAMPKPVVPTQTYANKPPRRDPKRGY